MSTPASELDILPAHVVAARRKLGTTVVVLTGRNVSWRRFEELVRP